MGVNPEVAPKIYKRAKFNVISRILTITALAALWKLTHPLGITQEKAEVSDMVIAAGVATAVNTAPRAIGQAKKIINLVPQLKKAA